jgi:hypothetical protein
MRYEQRLPLPIGGRDPFRRYGRLWFVSGRDRLRILLLTAGVIAAAAGGLVGSQTPAVAVSADNNAYSLGSIHLPAQSPGIYAGPEGAVVIEQPQPGVIQAGGSTNLHGVPMLGTCAVDPGDRTESCLFSIAGQTLRADDIRTNNGWRRRYQDGQEVDISLPAGTVPVPFALGR